MQPKGTAEVVMLLIKMAYSFIADREALKNLIVYTNREAWYIITIILLIIMTVSLASQVTILEAKGQTTFSCPEEKIIYIEKPIPMEYEEHEHKVSCEETTPPEPEPPPKKPLYVPPASTTDRREHDVRRLLNDLD